MTNCIIFSLFPQTVEKGEILAVEVEEEDDIVEMLGGEVEVVTEK